MEEEDLQKERGLLKFLVLEVLPLFDSPLHNDSEELQKKRKKRHTYIEKIKGTNPNLETLGKLTSSFNADYWEKGIIRNSAEEFSIFVETIPEYILYCDKHKRFYRFSTAKLEIKLRHEDLKDFKKFIPQPRLTRLYIHPKVFTKENRLFYTKRLTPPLLLPIISEQCTFERIKAMEIVGWLHSGVFVLMTEPVGKEDVNQDHDSFKIITMEEIMRTRIPVTNLKKSIRVVYEVSPKSIRRFVQEKIWTEV